MAWKTPPTIDVAMPAGTEMLPLIVGQSDENALTTTEVVEEAEVVEAVADK